MLAALGNEKVETWFDLGLFLDRLREERLVPAREAPEKLEDFQREITAGVGFLTFDFGVDGVVQQSATCLDDKRQWRQAGNVRFNAGIRSALHQVTSPLARLRRKPNSA